MVARQDDAVGLLQGNPAGCFQGLRRFVDEERVEMMAREHGVGRARQRGRHHAATIEESVADAYFQFVGPLLEACNLLVEIRWAPFPRLAVELADGAARLPKRRIVGVGLEAALIGVLQHGVGHARWISDAEHAEAAVGQLLRNPVNGRVALCANQHLRFAAQCFADGFNQCGGFARSRRTMNHHHIAGL